MKYFLAILLSSVCLAADWHDDCPVKDDWRGQRDWINTPVAWTTNNVTTISTNGDHLAFSAWYAGYAAAWRYDTVNGSPVQGILIADNLWSVSSNAAYVVDVTSMNQMQIIGACPQDFTITTNIVPMYTPARYRWQDYGLPGPQ